MSKQIAVRLPEKLVDFVDSLVGSGVARSRAAVIERALVHERRRLIAARDAAILAVDQGREDPDMLDDLARHVARTPIADLD